MATPETEAPQDEVPRTETGEPPTDEASTDEPAADQEQAGRTEANGEATQAEASRDATRTETDSDATEAEGDRDRTDDTRTDDAATTQDPGDADQPEAAKNDADTTKTFTIDTDPPEADGVKNYVKPAGTTPAWWEWVRRHRNPVLLVTGLLVVGLVATLVIISVVTPGPKEVVQEYMDAIRSGDTEAALAIAGRPKDTQRLAFLTKKALADDWTVDAIVERRHDEDDAEVDVTIRAGNRTQQGRFSMTHGEDGWKIDAPYVKVSLVAGRMDTVELGGEQQAIAGTTAAQNGVAELLVFPGVYELYPSLAKRATFEPSVLIATPQETEDGMQQAVATRTLTEAGKDEVTKAVNKYIDGCAKKSDISPSNCPFNAEDSSALWRLDYITDVTWTVLTYPEAHFATGNDNGIVLDVRKPGTVRLTGTGTPEEPDDSAPVPFTLTCEFGFSGIDVAMTMDGFEVGDDGRGSYGTELGTRCF